jgi:sugar lactone lactonase YvrE
MVEVAVDCRCLLGEGVSWGADARTLLGVDVDGRVLHALRPTCGTRLRHSRG